MLAGQSYAGVALTTDYQGHPAVLPLIRDKLRSYAASHGLTIHDRTFEEYLTEITETSADEARFERVALLNPNLGETGTLRG